MVRTGDRLDVEVAVQDNGTNWEWRVILNGSTNKGLRSQSTNGFVHNTRWGKLSSTEHRQSPDNVPVHTEKFGGKTS
jgi:hypothetical protein